MLMNVAEGHCYHGDRGPGVGKRFHQAQVVTRRVERWVGPGHDERAVQERRAVLTEGCTRVRLPVVRQ